jgi:hypothetical protein
VGVTKDELFESEGIALNWPLIVEFVADWLENYDGPGHSAYPDIVAANWREDMRE